ncbi:hypothetical protein NRZ32_17085 [Aeromonas dhakensis]|uniref:hypothetical protein n=1 Tax=Aeromonas dhakensis TaxID=196024 RepID=UPI00227B2AEB|nr:hypothetical protein [Aeromonas dhakensis]WAG10820.1 hypothetical protein NRZ32_17085 [Aeromonas dhakensis]
MSVGDVANTTETASTLLSDVGSWASIIGFLITIATLILVSGIRKRFLFRASIEEYKRNMIELSSELSGLLSDFESNKHDIDDVIARVDVALRAIESGAKDALLTDVKSARQKIIIYNKKSLFRRERNGQTEILTREIKTALSAISVEIDYVKKTIMVGS